MKIGTKSLLFGVHQFAWHPFTVLCAWVHLYGWPSWRELVCIIIHDWGYWGCAEMDGPEGSDHPWLGSEIAYLLFDRDYAALVLHHSRTVARRENVEPSRLCWPDKLCIIFDPAPFYLFRARLSGEIKEYRRNAHTSRFVPKSASDMEWYAKLTLNSVYIAEQHARRATP